MTFLENTAPYRRKLRESEYGYLDKDMEALVELSPITHLDKLRDPSCCCMGPTTPCTRRRNGTGWPIDSRKEESQWRSSCIRTKAMGFANAEPGDQHRSDATLL